MAENDEKKKKHEEELSQRKQEIANIEYQTKSTQNDIHMIEEKLDQLQNRIQIANTELNLRKRRLNDIESQIKLKGLDKNEEFEDSEEEDENAKAEQELKIKMLRMISNRQESDADPNELFFYDGQKSEVKSNIAIHTVKIKLVQSEGHSSQKTFSKIVPKDCTFRIHKSMTFNNLKEKACDHWMINKVDYTLYTLNFQYLDNEKMEANIEQHLNKNSIYPELWLLENAQYANKPDQFSNPYSVDDPLASKSGLKIIRSQNLSKGERDFEMLKETLEGYHHLKYFLPPIEAKSEDMELKRLHERDTSCCAFMFLILLLTTTLYVILERRNITNEFWTRERVYKSLMPDEFYKIADRDSAIEWMRKALADTFFYKNEQSKSSPDEILNYYYLVGPVNMRQARSKQMNCPRNLDFNKTFAKCYYKNTISGEKLTASIYIGPEEWRTYQSNTDYKRNFNGEFAVYDTSGFVMEFKNNQTSEYYVDEFDGMIDEGWISEATRVLFISANLYQPTNDLWVIVYIAIEFNTNSFAYPSEFEVVAMQPNIISKYPGSTLADVFRIIFSFYILYIYIFTILEFRNGRRNIQHMISFQGLMDLFLITMIIFSVSVSLYINKDEKQIYKDNKFVDLSYLINYYRLYHNSNSISLTLVIVRLLMFLTLNKRVFIYITTIRTAAKHILSFLSCLVMMLLGFTMIAQSLYGVYMYEYHNYIYTVISLLLFSMSHGNFDEMMKINIHWTAFFLILFFVVIIFFLISSFSGIFVDAYKVVRLVEGYEDDKTTWTSKFFLMWLIDWLPQGVKRKIFERKEKGKNLNDVDDEDDHDEDDDEAQD